MIVKDTKILKTNRGYPYKIISKEGRNKHGSIEYKIRFENTGYETCVTRARMRQGSIRDPYEPVVYGVGYLGEATKVGNERLYSLWNNMLSRCYNDVEGNKDYASYGGVGVEVVPSWHNFTNFIRDIKRLPGYDLTLFNKGDIQLDKDHLQQRVPYNLRKYGPETCCFVSKEYNQALRDTSRYRRRFKAIAPTGREYSVCGVVDFAKEWGLDASTIIRCLRGEYSQHKGWKFSE